MLTLLSKTPNSTWLNLNKLCPLDSVTKHVMHCLPCVKEHEVQSSRTHMQTCLVGGSSVHPQSADYLIDRPKNLRR